MKIFFFSILLLPTVVFSFQKNPEYSVPDKPWPDIYGSHRVVFTVDKPTEAIQLNVLWRRHDKKVDKKQFIIINAATNKKITNINRVLVNNEKCNLVIGPIKTPGTYYFYYLPYKIKEAYGFYNDKYLSTESPASQSWRSTNNLNNKSAIKKLPMAEVVSIQSRTQFDSFYPMEVIPTSGEKIAFLNTVQSDYILFPEGRENPIRMRDEIPLKWIESGIKKEFVGEAFKDEYFTFQVGLYAHKKELKNVKITFSELVNEGSKIAPAQLTCFNLEGIDPFGSLFSIDLDVAQGKVQPLWIGVDINNSTTPGTYKGNLLIEADGVENQRISIAINVLNKTIEARGDNESWRHSRLRWLNSTRGIDDKPTSQYKDINTINKNTYELSGKTIKLAPSELPSSINVFGTELLQEPIKFIIESSNGVVGSILKNIELTKDATGVKTTSWTNNTSQLAQTGTRTIESDGYINYKITLKATEDISLKDVRLEIPFKTEVAQYMMGMNLPGTEVPNKHKAKWRGPHDSFWMGNTNGGLWCEFRDESYHGPLLKLYKPAPPLSWNNKGKGGFRVKKQGKTTTAIAYSGRKNLKKGDSITFEWAFLITPVKKINYPFIAVDEMKGFVKEMHEHGQKVKIYYTVRELTNYTTEIWALRSLGNEILGTGKGGGFTWLQEHLIDDYYPQWYQYFSDKSPDASIVNAQRDSRWYNYYIESLAWLIKNIDIDGLYLDDVSYDRRILKRMRKVLDAEKPGCILDLHSNTGFSKGPATQYTDFFPYIDKLWFGESFNYNKMDASNWLVEVSGIPFGLMGDMLHNGGNRWLGMLYGMTVRLPWNSNANLANPVPIWEIWDQFEIWDATMIGFWEDDVPVTTDNSNVKVTVYKKQGSTLISIGNFSKKTRKVKLNINWQELGLDKNKVELIAPEIKDFQQSTQFKINEVIEVKGKEGWLIIIKSK